MAAPTRQELAKALVPVIAKSKDSVKLAKAIALYLSEHRQTKELDGLMRAVANLRSKSGTIEATVTAAFPLSPALKRDIRSLIAKQRGATEVILVEVTDPSVLGGIKIETGEHQLDVTVQQKLNRLKRAIA